MSISKQTWDSITIDFIIKLSKSKDSINNTNYNNIFIIIKRLIKYNKFIPINKSHSIKDLVDIIIQEVINNYKLLDEFIINKNITFILQFFITFTTKLKVNNKLSITFYLQTNKQIERFNQTIEQYFRYYINYNQDNWVKHLPIIQFIYNILIYIFTK